MPKFEVIKKVSEHFDKRQFNEKYNLAIKKFDEKYNLAEKISSKTYIQSINSWN